MILIKRADPTAISHRIVEFNGMIFLGGLTADDKSQSVQCQTEQITAKITRLLESCGSDKSRILSATIYLTDIKTKVEMDRAWVAFLPKDDLPARATVGVAELGSPETRIEISVVAAK